MHTETSATDASEKQLNTWQRAGRRTANIVPSLVAGSTKPAARYPDQRTFLKIGSSVTSQFQQILYKLV